MIAQNQRIIEHSGIPGFSVCWILFITLAKKHDKPHSPCNQKSSCFSTQCKGRWSQLPFDLCTQHHRSTLRPRGHLLTTMLRWRKSVAQVSHGLPGHDWTCQQTRPIICYHVCFQLHQLNHESADFLLHFMVNTTYSACWNCMREYERLHSMHMSTVHNSHWHLKLSKSIHRIFVHAFLFWQACDWR